MNPLPYFTPPLTKLAATTIVIGISLCSVQAQIISDDFTGTNGTLIASHTPNTNLPGGTWAANANAWGEAQIASNTLALYLDQGVGLSMASSGGYTKPTTITMSAVLNVKNINDSDGVRGVALGFYSTMANSGTGTYRNFNGFALAPDGNFKLVWGGTFWGEEVVQAIAYSGTWNATVDHALSYQVDTTTGNFSNVVLDGTTYTGFTASTRFTNAATAYAGFYVSSNLGAGSGIGNVDNFNVVPEPGTIALLGLGLTALLVIRKRKS